MAHKVNEYRCDKGCPNFFAEVGEAPRSRRCPVCAHFGTLIPPKPTTEFVVKDSGKREDFATGARRDTQDGKGDFARMPESWLHEVARVLQRRNNPNDRLDLIPVEPLLRLAAVYGLGCAKYDDPPTSEHPNPIANFRKGIPISRCVSSARRHLIAYAEGDQSEDHLAQAAWNCFTMLLVDMEVRAGRLPEGLGDYGPFLEPNVRLICASGICAEPGAAPILPLKKETILHAFGLGDPTPEHGFVRIGWRRAGAVLFGWVRAEHLTAIIFTQSSVGVGS